MTDPAGAAASQAEHQTTLQRILTATINEVGIEQALVAIHEREDGPLAVQVSRGFLPREVHAVLRTLSGNNVPALRAALEGGPKAESSKSVRLRMITPNAKVLLAVPLQYHRRLYGALVVGRKESVAISKKERQQMEAAGDEITVALERASLFDTAVIFGRSAVVQEPVATALGKPSEGLVTPPLYSTPQIQERLEGVFQEAPDTVPFDRAWVTIYDPLAGALEILGIMGEHKKDFKPGQRLGLDASAAGWAVRHRKPRVDQDLASTQGRFQDHKPLYKDRYRSTIVVPFFVRGQVGGTVALASTTPMQYGPAGTDAKALDPLIAKVAELLQNLPTVRSGLPAEHAGAAAVETEASSEPMIRKQERQAALNEFSSFLAAEVREPLASVRAQLEEMTAEGTMDFDQQTRLEHAMRDLTRIETILNEILDFAKPLSLNRRVCRVPKLIDHALELVSSDFELSRIEVKKEYAHNVSQIRCDESKLQQALLSIFKNSLEAMSPGGRLEIHASVHRGARPEAQITIKNNGAPIPPEYLDQVFEPYFTTKRAGTGLGLATAKKIVEEHQGHISIASGQEQGTTVTIRLPLARRRPVYRHRGRGRGGRRTR